MEAVSRREGVNRSAEMYGVPSTTLKDRISGRVVHKTKAGPKPYLNRDEEENCLLFDWYSSFGVWENAKSGEEFGWDCSKGEEKVEGK